MLIGERKSIVDEMEGVTRDINMKMIETEKSAFYLYDTAGYLEKGDEFNKLVQEKVRQAIADSEIVLFMVDGRDYHPVDDQLAVFLSQQKKPVIVIANKLDNPKLAEQAVYEFYNLGFDEVMPISVLQRRGFRELLERLEKQFKKFKPPKKKDKEIRIAIVGKPNVGKSCLLNTLLGYERSIVSPVPGTTRDPLDDVIEYEGHTIRLSIPRDCAEEQGR
jgi:GTP-binding protein